MPFAALALVLLGALWGVGGPRRAGDALARAARGRAPGSWRPGMGALALGAAVAALFLAARQELRAILVALGLGVDALAEPEIDAA